MSYTRPPIKQHQQMDKTGNGQMNDSSSWSSRQPMTSDKGALVFELREVTQVNKGKG